MEADEISLLLAKRWPMCRQVRETRGAHERGHFCKGEVGPSAVEQENRCTGALLGVATREHGRRKLGGSIMRRGTGGTASVDASRCRVRLG